MESILTELLYILLQQGAFIALAALSIQPTLSTRLFPIVFNFGFALASIELALRLIETPEAYWFFFAGVCFVLLGALLFKNRHEKGGRLKFGIYYGAYNVLIYVGYVLGP